PHLLSLRRRPPLPTPFPYTTLFRSVFPETQQFDNFNPPASLLNAAQAQSSLNFNPAVLGSTTVSFTAFDPHAPAQYVQQWSTSVDRKSTRLNSSHGSISYAVFCLKK